MHDPRELQLWSAAIDTLVERRRLPTLSSAAWTSSLWEGFFAGDQEVEVHLLELDGAVVAVFPLRRERGIARKLVGLQNPHVPFWMPALDDGQPHLAALLLDQLLARCDCLELQRLPLDGPLARALRLEASFRDFPFTEQEHPQGEVSLTLFGPWSSFEPTLSKNLRRDGRQIARLEALGKLEFELVESGPALGPALDACFRLEAQGGKGVDGRPKVFEPGARLFYKLLAARAAAQKKLALYLLKLDGRVVAFEYDLRSEGRLDCLKIGHDESLARHLPGTILRMLILRRSIERGEATSYHLGQASPWKARWASETERVGTLRVFADSARARLVHWAVPIWRNTVERLPGARIGACSAAPWPAPSTPRRRAVAGVRCSLPGRGFFNGLGVGAILGRTFSAADDNPACGSPGAVLSHAFGSASTPATPTCSARPSASTGARSRSSASRRRPSSASRWGSASTSPSPSAWTTCWRRTPPPRAPSCRTPGGCR